MTLDQIRQTLEEMTWDAVREGTADYDKVLKMVEEYAEEAYSDGFEQGWEENDLH